MTDDKPDDDIPDRTVEQVTDSLVWRGNLGPGAALRFYAGDGTPLTPEEVALRKPPTDTPKLHLKFRTET